MMASNPESQPKKRESRTGRKVTSLSAEQLERKRANDREAQRTIRQRTKEHIERLEHQVAELKSKKEQYDHVVRRNAALENEIRSLRQQLALATGGQGYSNPATEGSYTAPSGPVLPSTQFTEPLSVNPVSRTPSALSVSSQVSSAHDWQQYNSTGSPSICESSDTDYPSRVETFMFEGQLQTPNPMTVAAPQASFNAPGCHTHEPAFHSYSHLYQGAGHNQVRQEEHPPEHPHNPQHTVQYVSSQRSMSVPTIPSERELRGYPVLHATQQYQQVPEQPPRHEYNYDWTRRS
ncbi:hypothetical protein ETB97_012372 [Aspergillus alliaceus]|uniref:BZIP domain-containing protein n=1 Tax=Petromyces alliaceus TaxID=209559 RepID=A0A5N7C6X8_PETAA|nr:hypothetical protein BDV23DRAFT_91570 [Aspergillus alliaceus]KAF5861900.1 hypothetical protein ETB97_012372 [Aspergillus burnettii]